MPYRELNSDSDKLRTLKQEHAAIDEKIRKKSQGPYQDQLEMRNLKRHRLQLKEQIEQLSKEEETL